MKILTVIPIAKGIPRDQLSYFSARAVAPGTLVTVPFRKKSMRAVVVDETDVRDLKSSIKTNTYALRNITEIHTDKELPAGIFLAAQKTAQYFAQPIGSVLQTVIPNQIFDYYLTDSAVIAKQEKLHPDVQAMQVPFRDRLSYYKTLVRENLAKNTSTIIMAPTVIQAEKLFEEIKNGIEDRIAIAHSKKTKKHIEKVIAQSANPKKPMVLIATAPFVALPRSDWENIIIEQASSPHYRYEFGPIFDLRFFVEYVARYYGARLLYADTFISLGIRNRIASHEITDMRSTWHIAKPENFQLIHMKGAPETAKGTPLTADKKIPPKKVAFSMLHAKTVEMIEEAVARTSNILLVTTRKGLAPLTICADCGTTVTCPICSTPLVLHRKKPGAGNLGRANDREENTSPEPRIYMCHHCMHTTAPIDKCLGCGGWRLTPLGISTDGIRAEAEKKFPKQKVFLADGDMTPAEIQKTIKSWEAGSGAILVATPVVLPYIDAVDYGCMVSMDSLLSLPAYTSGEHALGTALEFLEKIHVGATLQTRNSDHGVIQAINTENIFDFVRNELETRAQFGYPPAKVLLKVSLETKKVDLKEAAAYLEKVFKASDPDILIKRAKNLNNGIIQAIMKIEPAVWNDIDQPLHGILRELSREFKKEVNPDSVL